MVHEAPTARATPQFPAPVGKVPVVTRVNGVVGLKVKAPPAKGPVPVFVTVRFMGLLVVAVAQFPKASGLGVTEAVSVGARPVPFNETGETATNPFEVTETVAVTGPTTVGVNATAMVQCVRDAP